MARYCADDAGGALPSGAREDITQSETADAADSSQAAAEQLIEVIACGRPATEMPHFDKYAYEDKACYGLSARELGKDVPPDPHSTPLTKREIEAVVDYILATLVGK